jgi:hypothetical protein
MTVMHQNVSILAFKRARYLKLALGLCALAIGLYLWRTPPFVYIKPYGGTWLGYTLGTVAAILILWLMMLGVRKRRYRSTIGSVEGWTSAHVYIGTSLIIITTLHCAFEFGWNIHTLAYALMVIVILSGFFGVYTYLRNPELMTDNLAGEIIEIMLLKIEDLDRKCRRLALDLPDEINAVVMKATRASQRELAAENNFRRQITAINAFCPTRAACDVLKHVGMNLTPEQARINGQLLSEMTRKCTLIDRVRRDMRFRALIRIWLHVHVPLSFALLAALIAHILSVFYYR